MSNDLPPFEKMDDAAFRQAWRSYCRYRPPRTFMLLLEVQRRHVLRACGLSELGYHDEYEFTEREILAAAHPNQVELLRLQTAQVYEIFVRQAAFIKGKGVVFCNTRSFRTRQGAFLRVHQASVPVRYNEAGVLTQYLSFYRILGPYSGEPLETYVYAADAQAQEVLTRELLRLKAELPRKLGFSKAQCQVIRLVAQGLSKAEIAEALDIELRTIDKHRSNILSHGRDIFPANGFSTGQDVVDYLVRQGLVG